MIKIYTEDVNRDRILKILDEFYPSYTVMPAIGRWEGISENALVIEVISTNITTALAVATRIKEANEQDCVLVSEFTNLTNYFI